MGNKLDFNLVNFENVQSIIKNKNDETLTKYILINTLPENEQNCLIVNTVLPKDEEEIINKYIQKPNKIVIVIYGKNCNDKTTFSKYTQLLSLGYKNTFIYMGGLFEWLTLQDIFTAEHFPTTSVQRDFLQYKPKSSSFSSFSSIM
jgi:hypothetical protein